MGASRGEVLEYVAMGFLKHGSSPGSGSGSRLLPQAPSVLTFKAITYKTLKVNFHIQSTLLIKEDPRGRGGDNLCALRSTGKAGNHPELALHTNPSAGNSPAFHRDNLEDSTAPACFNFTHT